jgi:hypothetical protein
MPRRAHPLLSAALGAWTVAVAMLGLASMPDRSCAAGAAASSPSRTTEARPRWSELSPSQRESLKPLERDWPTIDASRKQKWVEVARRMPSMAAPERERVQTRMSEWAALSPQQRSEARLHFQEAKQVSPKSRQDRWTAYQALPAEQRQQLAARAAPPPASGARRDASRTASAKSKDASSAPRLVAPTVVQVRPGATTTLLSRKSSPPAHLQPGLPKVAATPGFVDSRTLLPKRGPQGAAVRSVSAASAPGSVP